MLSQHNSKFEVVEEIRLMECWISERVAWLSEKVDNIFALLVNSQIEPKFRVEQFEAAADPALAWSWFAPLQKQEVLIHPEIR